jgi:hypothetical protein
MTLGFAGVVVILFFSFNLGSLLLTNLKAEWDVFRVYMSVALGLATYSYFFTFFGMASILSRYSILALFGVSQLVVIFKLGFKHIRLCYYATLKSTKSIIIFCVILFTAAALHPILQSFGNPVVGYDALAYHAYLPWFAMTDSHSLRTDQLIPNSGLSLGAQGIFGSYIAIFGYKSVNLFNLFFLLGTLHLTYLYSKNPSQLARVARTLLALVIVLLSGRIVVTSPSSDLALMFFCLVLLISMLRITQSSYKLNPFWIFVLGGFVTFIKPFGLVVVLIVLAYCTYKLKLPLTTLARSILLGFFVNLAWALYNYYYSSNPFFPLFQGFFQGIGYGPEVMTNEEDVRRSFIQTFSYIEKQGFSFPSLELAQFQIFFSLAIFLVSILTSVRNIVFRKDQTILLFYFGLSYVFLLLYIGPIFRYFLFINLIQIFLVFGDWTTKKAPKLERRNSPGTATMIGSSLLGKIGGTLVVCLSLTTFSSTKMEYQVKDTVPPHSLTSVGLTVNEIGFRKVIDYFSASNFTGARLALLGEGRAALFYPKSTLVLPGDRRNPFFDPEIRTLDEIQIALSDLGVDYLLISTSWGWPANANLGLIEGYQQAKRGSLVFTSEGWEVYEV